MNRHSLLVATLVTLVITMIFQGIAKIDSSFIAEETFGQNDTFLDGSELMHTQIQTQTQTQKPTPTISLASQNQTGLTESTEPSDLLKEQFSAQNGTKSSAYGSIRPTILIVTAGENVFITWSTNETGNEEVMFRASSDNGETFGETINLSNSTRTNSDNAEMAVSEGKVFVAWQEGDPLNGTRESVFRISNDNGLTFGPIIELSTSGTLGVKRNGSNMPTYLNSSHGVQIQYPVQWQIIEGKSAENSSIIDVAGFVSPNEYRLDKYREKIWISFENLQAENVTLEEYSRDLIDYKNDTLQNFDLLDYSIDSDILAGYPAYGLVYSEELDDGLIIKQMETGTKVGDRIYFLTFFAEEEKYDDYLPIIKDMINSFDTTE